MHGGAYTLHHCALGVVGGGVHWHGRASLPGVVEAVLPGGSPEVGAVAAQDHGAAQDTQSAAHPAGVEGEAEGHQALVLVDADGEPDGGYDAAHGWGTHRDVTGAEEEA